MKAISLWQPWATLVALKLKTIETRTHDRFKKLVGQRIAIHAARKWNEDGLEVFHVLSNGKFHPGFAFMTDWMNISFLARTSRGKIVCTAMVVDVQWVEDIATQRIDLERRALCDVNGKNLIFLDGIELLKEQIPFKGRQGIFNVPDELFQL